MARPPSATYRLQKAIRRNKAGFSAAALVVLALVAGALVSAWQAVRATRAERSARDEALKASQAERNSSEQAALAKEQGLKATQAEKVANEQAATANAVKDFLSENLLGVNYLAGTQPDLDAISFQTTRALVEKVARKVEGKFTNQPLIEAEIRMTLRWAFAGFSDTANLAAQAEKALEIRQRLLGPAHSDTLMAVAVLAHGKGHLGRRTEALKLLDDALSIARNTTNELSLGAAWLVFSYGQFLNDDGQSAKAVPYLKESVARLRRTLDAKHLWIKHAMGTLGGATERAGQNQEAEALRVDVIEQCERDHGPDHPMTVGMQHGLARLWVEQKRWQEGIPLLERVIALFQQQGGKNDRLALDAQYLLGLAYEGQGRIEDAEKLYADLHPRWAEYLPRVTSKRLFR